MAVKRISRVFRDISLSFIPHPLTGDIPIIKNERAIAKSVRNLVMTIPTERFFNPLLGSDVRSSLFEFVDVASAESIKTQIDLTLKDYEPRIENVVIEVYPNPDENRFDINVIFDIIGQQFPRQNVSFILEATR